MSLRIISIETIEKHLGSVAPDCAKTFKTIASHQQAMEETEAEIDLIEAATSDPGLQFAMGYSLDAAKLALVERQLIPQA